MSFLPLTLGVRRAASDTSSGASTGKAGRQRGTASKSLSAKAQEAVLQSDGYVCQACGFRSKRFQRVAEIESKPVTLCIFCEQCLVLDGAGGSGILIWLPEIAQADLNHLMRAIYIARDPQSSTSPELSKLAHQAFDALTARRTDAKKRLGTDDPLLLATVFNEALSDAEYHQSHEKLEGVRLLPPDRRLVKTKRGMIDQFPQILNYWQSPEGPYGHLPVEDWADLFASVSGNA